MERILNIINFIRDMEPRPGRKMTSMKSALEYRFQQDTTTKTKMHITPGKIHFEHNTFQYDLCRECGKIHASDKGTLLFPVNRNLIFSVGASDDHFSEQ